MKVTIRSLSGNQEIVLEGDSVTVADLKEAAGIAAGFNIRAGGQRLSDDTPVQPEGVYTATPPEAKHG